MKKKTKIALSILGVFLVLTAAATVFLASQGFFKHIKSPEIESIGFSDNNPVSVKDLEAAVQRDKEMFPNEPMEDHYLSLGETGSFRETGIEYTYEVHFTDGTIQEISSLETTFGTKTKDGMHTVFVDAYVSYNDYLKAKEEGQDTVPVYIEAEIYKADYDPAPADFYEGTAVKKYIDGFVEEIEPLFDKELTVKGTEYEFENKKFRIKYTDGTEKTLSPISHKDKNISNYECRRYSLDGTYMVLTEVHTEEGLILTVKYLDSEMKFKLNQVYTQDTLPVEKIEIKDYEIDINTGKSLSTVTYTVTKKDGTAVEITSHADENGNFDSGYIDGCSILVKTKKTHKPSGVLLGIGLSRGITFDTYVTEQIETPEKITLLDVIDFEYLGALFFAFVQGIPEILS